MKRLLHTLLLIIMILPPMSALAGQWEAYTFTDQYRRICCIGNDLYILKGNSLVRAHADTWEIDTELNREKGLSASNIIDICYSHELRRMAIVYDNCLIDIVHPDGSVWTIPDLYNAPMAAIDKTIVSCREQEGLLFLHTAYGFAVVDLSREIILQNFNLGTRVKCAWAFNGDWYYSYAGGTYYCPQKGGNPFAPNGWKMACGTFIDKAIVLRGAGVQQCWVMTHDGSLRRFVPGRRTPEACYGGQGISDLHRASHYIMTTSADSLVLFDTQLGPAPIEGQIPLPGQRIACTQKSPYAKAIGISTLHDQPSQMGLLYADRGVIADSLLSVNDHTFTFRQVSQQALSIDNHQQSGLINRIVTDGQGEVLMSYIPALSVGYTTMLKAQGFYTTVQTATGKWNNYSKENVTNYLTEGNKRFVGLSDLIADPFNPKRYYFSSLEDGIIAIQDGKLFARYDANTTNLGLEVCAPNCTRIGGMGFSNEGDLWCFDEGHNYGLRVHQAADDKWYRFRIEGLEKEYGFTHLCVTRRNGHHQVWGYQHMKYEQSNLFCYDYGQDIADKSDDRYIFFRKLTPDTPGAVPFIPYYARNVYEGPTGAIWLLNTSGIYVIDDPTSVFDHPGDVRTVMDDCIPTSMTIDNRQRVWIATEDQGIFLLSSDGREQLAHYTSSNTILNSDEVQSVCFDPTQSTLWIATDGQILTFSYDDEEFDTNDHSTLSQAYCYPSRITRYTPTEINVYGLLDGSEAWVSNSQGRILSRNTALGGIFTFDAQSFPVGTYTISGIDIDGKRGELLTFEVEP